MKDVRIQNYQGAEDVSLEFHPGVNVIIGPTDSGKSSVIRALRDWSYNRAGHGHLTGGAKKSVVDVDGVRWEKSKSVNRYVAGDQVFDKVGRDVPEQVKEITGIREVEFGEGVSCRLHFAEQFGAEFMVGFKPSDNAKIVGSLSGIHAVFNALRDATADHVKARREVKELERSVEESQVSVAKHSWVKPIAKRVKENVLLLKAVMEAEKLIERWKDLRETRLVITTTLSMNQKEQDALQGLASIDMIAVEDMSMRIMDLSSLKDTFWSAKIDHDRYLSACERLQVARDVDLSGLEGDRKRIGVLRTLSIRMAVARKSVAEGTEAREKLQVAAGVDLGALEGDRDRLNELMALSGRQGTGRDDKFMAEKRVYDLKVVVEGIEDEYTAAVDGMDLCPVTGKTMPEDCKKAIKEG